MIRHASSLRIRAPQLKKKSMQKSPAAGEAKKNSRKHPKKQRSVVIEDPGSFANELVWLGNLPSLGGIIDFGDVLKSMRTDVSFREAIAIVNDAKGKSVHTKSYQIKSVVEGVLGMDLFVRRPGNGRKLFAPTSGVELQRLNLVVASLDKIVRCFKDIANAKTLVDRPEVRIGAITSIIQYLGVPLLDHMQRSFNSRNHSLSNIPHLSFAQGEENEQIEALLSNKSDFFLFQSGLRGLKTAGIQSTPLPYYPKPFGLVFLKEDRNGVVPFSDLCQLLRSRTTESMDVHEMITKHPILLIHNVRNFHSNTMFQSIHNTFFEGLNAGLGQRIFLPTFRIMRYMVHCGRGIGFGHKPANATLVGKIDDSDIYVGEDRDMPGNKLHFIDLSVLEVKGVDKRWQEPPPFSVYYRDKSMSGVAQGGFSDPVRFVYDCLMEIVYGQAKMKYSLDYEEGKLLHNFHSADILPPPEFMFSGSTFGYS